MSWFKNQWDKGGKHFPENVTDSQRRWFEDGGKDPLESALTSLQSSGVNISLSTTIDNDEYGFETFFTQSNGLYYSIKPKFLKFKDHDITQIKKQYDTNPPTLSTLIVPAFYGNTLELDPDFTATNPFRRNLFNDGNEAKYNNATLTVYDIIKRVTDASENKGRLSIVVIGNYADIDFTTDDVFNTEQDKINRTPLTITAHNFMQRRATTFMNTFLSGLSCPVTAIAADDASNTYEESLMFMDPNPLSPADNREGISVLFLPVPKSKPKF